MKQDTPQQVERQRLTIEWLRLMGYTVMGYWEVFYQGRKKQESSTVEPQPTKGHNEPSHDVIVMRLRKRIDDQTKVMTEQFARIKELESKLDDATITERNRVVECVVSMSADFAAMGDVHVWEVLVKVIATITEVKQ